MLETDAPPDEVVSWFRAGRCRDDVMVVWVSGERQHEQLLRRILDEAPAIDTVLQDKVAFLFASHDGAKAVRSGGLGDAPFFQRVNRPGAHRTSAATGKLARATAAMAGDFAALFDLRKGEAPALVVLVKDLPEHVVAPMMPTTTLGDVRPWLATIVESARRHRERCATMDEDPVLDGPAVQRLEDASAAVEANRRDVREAVQGLLGSHPGAGELTAPLANLLVRESVFDPTEARLALARLREGAAAPGLERLLRDGRLAKLDKLLLKLEGVGQELGAMLTRRVELQEQHDRYKTSLAQLDREIRSSVGMLGGGRMAHLRSKTAAALDVTPRFLRKASRVIRAINVAYKAVTGSEPPWGDPG